MAGAQRVLILGATGVFGRLLARELAAHTSAELLLASRDERRAAAVCRELGGGPRARPIALDLRDPTALAEAARGCTAVVCAAGPFATLPRGLPAAALSAGAHWVDIADEPGWVLSLLGDDAVQAAAERADRAVLLGLSTLPALSGMLLRRCLAALPGARRGRVTLFIGNRNAKGAGAVASVLGSIEPGARRVSLPVGARAAYRFRTPDAALARRELGVAVEARVAFELGAAGMVLAAIGPLARRLGPARRLRLASTLAAAAAPLGGAGTDIGCVQAEVWDAEGDRVWAALLGHGQRVAVLPAALALGDLLGGQAARGVISPSVVMGGATMAGRLVERGVRLREGRGWARRL